MALLEENVAAQEEALEAAHEVLRYELKQLATEAAFAWKAGKRRNADLPAVYARVNAVRRAEEAVDLAALDLATAQGEDA